MNKETTSVLDAFLELRERLKQDILGQHMLVERLLLALLADGHLLVEGAPGLAKTRAVKMLGETIEGDFHRIQFTPDLLPSDVTGHIRWKQIWSKLNSVKISFDRFSKHLHGTGFRQSWRSFNKEMPVSKQSQEQTLNQHMLAQNVLFQPFT